MGTGEGRVETSSLAPRGRTFYWALALTMTVLVLLGFWPPYFAPLLSGRYGRHWIFHVHAVVFLSWMGLLIVQALLIRRRATRRHMAVGARGFSLAGLVFVMGLVVSFVLMAQLLDREIVATWPEALWAASAPLLDMTQFAILIGLGSLCRRRPEAHKRYMVLATIAILPAATARMAYLLGPWSLEILFAALAATLVAYDLRRRGSVHRANVVGLLILFPRVILDVSFKILA